MLQPQARQTSGWNRQIECSSPHTHTHIQCKYKTNMERMKNIKNYDENWRPNEKFHTSLIATKSLNAFDSNIWPSCRCRCCRCGCCQEYAQLFRDRKKNERVFFLFSYLTEGISGYCFVWFIHFYRRCQHIHAVPFLPRRRSQCMMPCHPHWCRFVDSLTATAISVVLTLRTHTHTPIKQ